MATPAHIIERNRQNGQYGGRPPGVKNKRTRRLDAARRRLELAIAEQAADIIAAQVRIALQTESYAAANSACENLLDRAFGRPTAYVDAGAEPPRDPVTIVYVFAAGTGPTETQVIQVPPAPKQLPLPE